MKGGKDSKQKQSPSHAIESGDTNYMLPQFHASLVVDDAAVLQVPTRNVHGIQKSSFGSCFFMECINRAKTLMMKSVYSGLPRFSPLSPNHPELHTVFSHTEKISSPLTT
ncbi:hypothetical protein ILYODFUR_013326 [Ilyodon furcidens]|uniref:Uncharacterized protein n=1 Tax=Ilyodon furcidens TaxID=33524 RepID=A0ABV0VDN6_9TELE